MKVQYHGAQREVYTKEPRIVEHATQFVTRRRTVIQAGAHVGVWPAELSKHFEQVVAFEPKYESYEACHETFDMSRVLLINGALHSSRDLIRIHGAPFSGSNRIVEEGGSVVTAYTIDSLPSWIRNSVDAIFLDVEGHELHALRGGIETIRKNRPLLVLEHEGKFSDEDLRVMLPSTYEIVGEFRRDMILKDTSR